MFAVGTRSNVTVPATVTAGPVGGGVLSSPPWWQPPRRSTASVVAARRRVALEVILFLRSKLRGYFVRQRARREIDDELRPLRALFRRAALRPVRRRPARGLLVRQVEQHGLDFLDVAVAHGEEFGDEPVVGGGHALALGTALEPEAHDRQHDAALFVHDGVAAVPDVAADEPALVEALRRVV